MARMRIDPGAEEQPVDGVILILSPALASCYFTFTVLSCTHTFAFPLISSSFLVLVLLFQSASIPTHTPSWIKLFIWPKPQPAGK